MPQISSIWLQTLMVGLLSVLAQFRYLEHIAQVARQTRVPFQVRYGAIHERVLAVDQHLLEEGFPTLSKQLDHNSTAHTQDAPFERGDPIQAGLLHRASQLWLNVDKPCGGNYGLQTSLVVMVFNRVEDYFQRKAIRATFGGALKRASNTEIYFIVARRVGSELQSRVEQESQLFNDMIQVDYLEDYYNCTIKAVALVRWVAMYCPLAKFVMKLDDDSFIRMNPLMSELERLEPNAIMGFLGSLWEPRRDNGSKWFVKEGAYPDYFYPPYIAGIYLLPASFAIRLYEAIVSQPRQLTIPAFPYEDVYMTGMLASKARLVRIYWESQLMLTEQTTFDGDTLTQVSVMYNTLCPFKMRELWKRFGQN